MFYLKKKMTIQIQLPKNKSTRLQSPTLKIQWNLEKNSLVLVKSVISFHELEKKRSFSPCIRASNYSSKRTVLSVQFTVKLIERTTLLLVKVSERERIIYFHTTSRRASNFCSPFLQPARSFAVLSSIPLVM